MYLRLDYSSETNIANFSMSVSDYLEETNDLSLISTVDATEWSEIYSSKNNLLSSSLLPPAVRYLSSDRRLIVWERPPTYKTINYTSEYQDNLNVDSPSVNSYRIPIPWQVYVLYLSPEARLANIFMFFRNSQLTNLFQDPLYMPILPNFYENSRLCQAAFETIQQYDRDILSAINAAYEMVWNSGFNKDTLLAFNHIYTGSYVKKNNPLSLHGTGKQKYPQNTFDKWTHYSIEDCLSWDWPVAYATLSQFLKDKVYKYSLESDSHNFMVNMLFAAQDTPQKNKTIA